MQFVCVELFRHKVGVRDVVVAPLAGLESAGTVGGVVHWEPAGVRKERAVEKADHEVPFPALTRQ